MLFFASFIEFYQCFDCQSKILHRARGFCFFRGVRDIPVKSTNFFQTCWISMTKVEKKKKATTNKQTKTKKHKNAWKRYFFLIACNLRLFAHSSSSPKKKVLKGVVDYQQTRVTLLAINLISTFCTQFQLFALKTFIFLHCSGLIDALSANERAEIFASILIIKEERDKTKRNNRERCSRECG